MVHINVECNYEQDQILWRKQQQKCKKYLSLFHTIPYQWPDRKNEKTENILGRVNAEEVWFMSWANRENKDSDYLILELKNYLSQMFLNSLWPSDIMWWHRCFTLVQVMACCLTAPSHYHNLCWLLVNWTTGNKFQWNLNRHKRNFLQEKAVENVVWKMPFILFKPQCVNTLRLRQDGRHFPDDIFKCIFLNENL